MKIAKANAEDLALAHELAGALEALSGNWGAVMPQAIAKPSEGEETEPFDIDNPEQCRRIAEYLFALGRKASLFRVAIGMQALLDPDTGLIDPNKSYLDVHPKIAEALAAQGGTMNALDVAKINALAERHGIDPTRLAAAAAELLETVIDVVHVGTVETGIKWTSGRSPDTGTVLYAPISERGEPK